MRHRSLIARNELPTTFRRDDRGYPLRSQDPTPIWLTHLDQAVAFVPAGSHVKQGSVDFYLGNL
jgi:hypothetical protein